jgi:hypothetical protein
VISTDQAEYWIEIVGHIARAKIIKLGAHQRRTERPGVSDPDHARANECLMPFKE